MQVLRENRLPLWRFGVIIALILLCVQSVLGQDTIFLRGDTIRVGELEWEIEKQWPTGKDWVTKNTEFYGENILIFHSYHRKGVIREISFGYMGREGFVPHGPTRYYYESGDLLGKRTYNEGKLAGEGRDFYPSRRVKMITHFVNGEMDSDYFSFWPEGTPESIAHFENGEQVGEEQLFYSNGNLREKRNFAKGQLAGPDSTWYETGDLESVSQYAAGKLDGVVRFFHRNGRAWTLRNYAGGKLVSIEYLKNAEGKPNTIGDFADGNGRVNVYSESSRLIGIEKYKNGDMIQYKPVKDKRLNGK